MLTTVKCLLSESGRFKEQLSFWSLVKDRLLFMIPLYLPHTNVWLAAFQQVKLRNVEILVSYTPINS